MSLCKQLRENSRNCSSQEQKKQLAKVICGKIVTRKKLKTTLANEKILSMYYLRKAAKDKNRMRKTKTTHITNLKNFIIQFFEDAENSCQAPGKRDYITKNKNQQQKRYLLHTMKELHKKFKVQTGYNKISYQTFVKLKPFWVVHKKLHQRDTCICITHANFKFKLCKLKLLKLLKTDSSLNLLRKSVCDVGNKDCMYGVCLNCSLKIPEELLTDKNFEDFNTFYYKWTTKKCVKPTTKNHKQYHQK